VGVFGGFLGKFISWAGGTIWNLLEIIFDVVSPGAFSYVKKTGAALKSILKNPLPFVGNLVKAAKLGFQNFADKFGTHLKAGLIDWLTGSLSGVYIPKALSLPELGKFAMSVLGITWAQIRGKIVKALGPSGETIMKGLETGFDIVVALVTGGPAAAWELIKEKLTELKDQVVSGIVGFVTDTVIKKAVPKLIAMFIPGAGFISAIISIYDTIMVFVEKISKIIQVVKGFIDSIVAIAGGAIGAAAGKVESILAGLLSLAISFLAGFVGLGKVADKIMEVINKVRDKVDKALDAAIAWIVDKAKKLFAKAKTGVQALFKWWKSKQQFKGGDAKSHTLLFTGEGSAAVLKVRSVEAPYSVFLQRAKVGTDPDRIKALKAAKDIALKIDQERAKPPLSDEKAEAQRSTKVNLLLEELKPHTSILFGTSIPDSAKTPNLGSVNSGGFGTSMTIKPLTNKNRPKGSDPTGSMTPKYLALNERRNSPGGASFYVKGHLLNQQLGGLGTWNNMTPLSREGNAQHERKAEAIVKRTVELPAIVAYSVIPSYDARGDKAMLVKKIEASKDSNLDKKTKKAIVDAEDLVPQSLSVKAWILDEDLKERESILSSIVKNPVERTFDAYHLATSPKPAPVDLSTSTADEIAAIQGIGLVLAERIVAERKKLPSKKWSSYAQVAEKIVGIGEGRLSTLEGEGYIKLFSRA
jgi:DNA uptake protein ComE-like DNA-binding protein